MVRPHFANGCRLTLFSPNFSSALPHKHRNHFKMDFHFIFEMPKCEPRPDENPFDALAADGFVLIRLLTVRNLLNSQKYHTYDYATFPMARWNDT